jgi:hypothetical protein
MRLSILTSILALVLGVGVTAQAGIIYSSTSGSIPDGSTVGWAATATASGYAASISDLSVNLNISGGYNGDLYAYLSYGGVLVPLLNRVGTSGGDLFGYADRGFGPDSLNNPFTLSDTGSYDVHNYQDHSAQFNDSGQLTGTWRPDGSSFVSFHDMNPNGTWTLFFADLSGGDQSTLVGWSLDITAVPEPVNVALIVFAVLAGGIKLLSHRGSSSQSGGAG